ncbi:hypothetical protein [Novosphingobium sp. 9U]|uniref:hypothetical protein n=1 Tax=Novosphingobium sp. 9U TaxID=2653158 RepID=UPI0012F45D9E|nr:hypothetical protein [Novosphingobium sp. 9U]VWX53928.1 hypothetical protein NOVOSPHI9U_500004 [Novosphingobium sp. 9U]
MNKNFQSNAKEFDEIPLPNEHRYVSHVEDDPMVWQQKFSSLEEAIDATRAVVVERMVRNGAGEGMIYDRADRRIVASCKPDVEGGRFYGNVQVSHFPSPEHLVHCARVVEGFDAQTLTSI